MVCRAFKFFNADARIINHAHETLMKNDSRLRRAWTNQAAPRVHFHQSTIGNQNKVKLITNYNISGNTVNDAVQFKRGTSMSLSRHKLFETERLNKRHSTDYTNSQRTTFESRASEISHFLLKNLPRTPLPFFASLGSSFFAGFATVTDATMGAAAGGGRTA
jgi:hypothetical protein